MYSDKRLKSETVVDMSTRIGCVMTFISSLHSYKIFGMEVADVS